jgi:hypothetical protein
MMPTCESAVTVKVYVVSAARCVWNVRSVRVIQEALPLGR